MAEQERVCAWSDCETVYRAFYRDGEKIVSVNRWAMKILLPNLVWAFPTILIAFFLRIPINLYILNRRYRRRGFPVYSPFIPATRGNFYQSFAIMFTLFHRTFPPGTRFWGWLANGLSVISLGLFLTALVLTFMDAYQ